MSELDCLPHRSRCPSASGGREIKSPEFKHAADALRSAFPPVERGDAQILILGSLPGDESLRRGEYYAKAQNRFWWIMGQIFGAGPDLPYAARCTRLTLHGIALWDVCAAAERLGSLDSAIVTASVVPNDFATFLQNHSAIRRIAFNGRKAEQLFVRHVLRASPQELAALPRVTLPSTSPAHAGIAANAKLASWREGLG